MTALLAAGGGLPLALHIPHVVEQAGSIAGFAAIIGLAVLSALYFSQARDLRRLREWAGRAPERAAEIAATGRPVAAPVPGRVVAVPQRAPQAVPGPSTTAGAGAQGAAQPAQPAAANGSPAPEVVKTADEATVGAGEAAKASTDGDGATAGSDGAPKPAGEEVAGDAAAKPAPAQSGMPGPASAAAAAGAGAAAAVGPAVPAGGQVPASPSASAPAAAPPGQAGPPAGPSPARPGQAGPPAGPSPAPSRPGQPGWPPGAPAKGGSAAGAAAGAAASGAAARPGAPPQRPPESVLPPRTGTLPPVRRLPSSNVGGPAAQTGVLGSGPPEQKRKRNPLYVALAVAGVLILGAGAAIGVPALVNGSKSDNSPKTPAKSAKKKPARKLAPIAADTITVSVLNATSIPGLAAQIADQAQSIGFNLGNTAQVPGILEGTKAQRANSVVMYVPGHSRDARLVAKKLNLDHGVRPIDAESRQLGGDATVVVVVGTDQTR